MTGQTYESRRIGYADPPYPGQSAKHYADHPDYAGEVDHLQLLKRLDTDFDGWVLHTSSTALTSVLYWAQEAGMDVTACAACHTPELPYRLVTLPLYGETRVCEAVSPCLRRARAFGVGIYGRAS